MKLRRIIIVGGMVAAFVLAVALSSNVNKMQNPPIGDAVEPADDYDLNLGSKTADEPTLEDAAVLNQTDSGFYYKDGKKHYTITATDEPTLED